jgi:hypothetical protein
VEQIKSVTGIPENPDKNKFGGSRAGKRKKKRLDELTGIYSQRVVSRPFRVAGCVTSDRDSLTGISRCEKPAGDSGPFRRVGSLLMLSFNTLDP